MMNCQPKIHLGLFLYILLLGLLSPAIPAQNTEKNQTGTENKTSSAPVFVVPETRQQVYETRTFVPRYETVYDYTSYYNQYYSNYGSYYSYPYYYSPSYQIRKEYVETVSRDAYVSEIPVPQRVPEMVVETQKAGPVSIHETVKPDVRLSPSNRYYGNSTLIYDSNYDRRTYDSREGGYHLIHGPRKGYSYLEKYKPETTTYAPAPAKPQASSPRPVNTRAGNSNNNMLNQNTDEEKQPATYQRHTPRSRNPK